MSYSSFSSNYNNPVANLGAGLANAESGAKNMFSKFRNNKVVSGTTDFLYSNSLVAKFCFFILVVILFIIFLRLGSRFIAWTMEPTRNPILIDGMKNARKLKTIPQDPKIGGAKPTLRSINQRDGLEFTWSVWMYVDDLVYKKGELKHVFHKGSVNMKQDNWKNSSTQGMAFPNNAPGLYLHETKNALVIVMNTFNNIIEKVLIEDIPINKWINVVIRVKDRLMDTYINGTIVSRYEFNSVPRQNYGDVYVNMNDGYSGMLSSLRYYDHAISGIDVENLVKAGPNLTADDSMNIFPPYFSLRWFFSK
jgi:hypothetical protein